MFTRICRLRRGRFKRVLIIVSLILVGLGMPYWIMPIYKTMSCSEEESHEVLRDTCHLYKKKQLVGDLCPHLCDLKNIKYNRCTNYREGKRVFLVDCQNFCQAGETIPAVLKTVHRNFSELQDYTLFGLATEEGNDGEQLTPTIPNIQSIIRDKFSSSFNLEIPENEDPIAVVWHRNYKDYYNPSDWHSLYALARSVWSLVDQTEYLMMKANQKQGFFPRIYGTCGSLYLVESSPPGDVMTTILRVASFPWEQRATLARKILDVVRLMDEGLHEPLHMCDVKGENFGVGKDSEIKLIDTDSVFFQTEIVSILKNDNCSRRGGCDFFDCQGFCNIQKQLCEPILVNNNLQNMCRKIFLGRLTDSIGGLLRNPPRSVRADLKSALRTCAYQQTFENGMPIQKPGDDIYWKIYKLLQKSINKQT